MYILISALCATVFVVTYFVFVRPKARRFVPTRAIVATDTNPVYFDFWPIVAKAWQKRIGVTPTLALIADDDVEVDETVGDVLRFKPIPGVPTSLYAQAIRLLLPACFENEICIIGDIDMIPISKSYYLDRVEDYPEDSFIVYRDKAYGSEVPWWTIPYIAAKGSTFKEIYGVRSVDDIPAIITSWARLGFGWHTDEIVMTHFLRKWKYFNTKCILLESEKGSDRISQGARIDRASWTYDVNKLLSEDYYVDCHSIRPYKQYKNEVDKLASLLGLND